MATFRLGPGSARLAHRTLRLAAAALLACTPLALGASAALDAAGARLASSSTVPGYLALLLVNESPFPGEKSWVSEEDTKATMLSILWVLHNRLKNVPNGYTQAQIASERCTDIIAVITAGGEKGQCDGFHRDASGAFIAVPRVHERVAYLEKCAGHGEPGRFARLLEYAQGLADAYVKGSIVGADRYAALRSVRGTAVTGNAYSWMTDRDCYSPGGNFVRIPDENHGASGGNRFFTLKKIP
jgi:hypothetical protein